MQKRDRVTKQVVVSNHIVSGYCDMCKREADNPEGLPYQSGFEWGGAGLAGGSLEWSYSIDGECDPNVIDLCYECAEKVAKFIKYGLLEGKGENDA
jgi:hypothetical protein